MAQTFSSWAAFRVYPWGWLFGVTPEFEADDEVNIDEEIVQEAMRLQRIVARRLMWKVSINMMQLLLVVTLAVERSFATVFPIKHARFWTTRSVTLIVCIVALVAFL